MSVIAIAGLVLGAFPIAISALRALRDAAELLDCWRNIRREHEKCITEINFQRIKYTNTLKQLLFPLVVDDETIQSLMDKPGGAAWKTPGIAEALKKRLQDSFDQYFKTVEEVQGVMDKINQELDPNRKSRLKVDNHVQKLNGVRIRFKRGVKLAFNIRRRPKDTSVPHPDASRRRAAEYLRRAKFLSRKNIRKRLFDELREGNDRLAELLRSSDSVSSARNARSMTTAWASATVISEFWTHAAQLYKALSGSWDCTCRGHHFARLALQHRRPSDKQFQVIFFSGSNQAAPGSNPNWQHYRLKVVERPGDNTLLEGNAYSGIPDITVTPAPPESNLPPISHERNEREDRISESHNSNETEGQISDLCTWLASVEPSTMECSGFLQEMETRYYLYPDNSEDSLAREGTFVTLAEILSRPNSSRPTRRQRYRVALDLASAFVQLKSTPWITAALRKTDIEFSHNDGAAQTNSKLGPPLIVCGFEHPPPEIGSTGIDKAAIAMLGVILLELCFGNPIETYRSMETLGNGRSSQSDEAEAIFDLGTAFRLQGNLLDEAGPGYAGAVEWCLSRLYKPTGSSWRKDMVQNVVVPLERCYSHLTDALVGSRDGSWEATIRV